MVLEDFKSFAQHKENYQDKYDLQIELLMIFLLKIYIYLFFTSHIFIYS
jgi:hypothetical protein